MDADVVDLNEKTTAQELVKKHRIRWQVHPEQVVSHGELMTVGYRVEMTAAHDHPAHEPWPGCPACAPVLRALQRVIAFVVPRGPHTSVHDVHLRHNVHEFTGSGEEARMSASIAILHVGLIEAPPDGCQQACLAHIVRRLHELGASEGN